MSETFFEVKQTIEEKRFAAFAAQKPEILFEFTPLHCGYDVKLKSGNTFFVGEIKVREYDNAYFEKNGPYLELKKIEGIQKKVDETKNVELQKLYFNFTTDGVQIFQLRNPHEYNFIWRLLPKDNENKNVLIWKLVTPLYKPIEQWTKNKPSQK